MGKWCPNRKKYFSDFELIDEELDKENIDKKEIKSLIFQIECDYQDLEEEVDDLEEEVSTLKRDVDALKNEVDWYVRKDNPSVNPSLLDSYFKKDIFKILNEKYTWYQLEELLKSNNII